MTGQIITIPASVLVEPGVIACIESLKDAEVGVGIDIQEEEDANLSPSLCRRVFETSMSIPQLVCIGLSGLPLELTKKDLLQLKWLQRLGMLYLGRLNNITDEKLRVLGDLALKTLDVNGCANITDTSLGYLHGQTQMLSLHLKGCTRITDDGLKSLRGMTQMMHLFLGGCKRITDAGLYYLRNMRDLEDLVLDGCTHITDAGLKHFKRMTKMKVLDLGDCSAITDVCQAGLNNKNEMSVNVNLGQGRC